MRIVRALCLAGVLSALLAVGVLAGVAMAQVDDSELEGEQAELMVTQLELENEKLQQEINKLESDQSGWARTLASIPLIGGVVAAGAAAVGVIRQWRETNRQREADRRQREREAEQRLEERMAGVVANLGSKNEALQASSVASLLAFLMPRARNEAADGARRRWRRGHRLQGPSGESSRPGETARRTVWLVLANLKVTHTAPVKAQLVKVFERALRLCLPDVREDFSAALDMSRADLVGIDLSGLNLRGADVAFADLTRANFNGTDLYRARGYRVDLTGARLSLLRRKGARPVRANLGEARLRKAIARGAQFHEARLNSARLEDADLRGAEFQGAHLQAAHLNGADLRGAVFQGADISDTDFRGARLDYVALRSLRATRRNRRGEQSWRRAKFDPKHAALLEGMNETIVASASTRPSDDNRRAVCRPGNPE